MRLARFSQRAGTYLLLPSPLAKGDRPSRATCKFASPFCSAGICEAYDHIHCLRRALVCSWPGEDGRNRGGCGKAGECSRLLLWMQKNEERDFLVTASN